MSSLFELDLELQRIFDEIEENEGELTPELEQRLEITQEEMYEKLDNYRKYVSSLDNDILAVKTETERLKNIKTVKENRLKRLKSAMLDCVYKYGNDGKSGNKVIDLPTAKLFTRRSSSIDIDQERQETLISLYATAVQDLLNGSYDITPDTIIERINELYDITDFTTKEHFTLEDLQLVNVSLTRNTTLFNLMISLDKIQEADLIDTIFTDESLFDLSYSITKIAAKDLIKETNHVTICTESQNVSLQIK